jgi:hypothetical protein
MIMLITCLIDPKCGWILKSEFKFEVIQVLYIVNY